MSQSLRRLALLVIFMLAWIALCMPAFRHSTKASSRLRPSPDLAHAAAPHSASSQILAVMSAQVDAWNRGDVNAFMQSYWHSGQTVFVGAKGLVRGWDAVMARYHRDYPDLKAMGHLTFSDLEVHASCGDAAFVIGQYHLTRESGKVSGIFTLDFRHFSDGWKIVADHTTAFAPGAEGVTPQ